MHQKNFFLYLKMLASLFKPKLSQPVQPPKDGLTTSNSTKAQKQVQTKEQAKAKRTVVSQSNKLGTKSKGLRNEMFGGPKSTDKVHFIIRKWSELPGEGPLDSGWKQFFEEYGGRMYIEVQLETEILKHEKRESTDELRRVELRFFTEHSAASQRL